MSVPTVEKHLESALHKPGVDMRISEAAGQFGGDAIGRAFRLAFDLG